MENKKYIKVAVIALFTISIQLASAYAIIGNDTEEIACEVPEKNNADTSIVSLDESK